MIDLSPNDIFRTSTIKQWCNADYVEQLQSRVASDPAAVDRARVSVNCQPGASKPYDKHEADGSSWTRTEASTAWLRKAEAKKGGYKPVAGSKGDLESMIDAMKCAGCNVADSPAGLGEAVLKAIG